MDTNAGFKGTGEGLLGLSCSSLCIQSSTSSSSTKALANESNADLDDSSESGASAHGREKEILCTESNISSSICSTDEEEDEATTVDGIRRLG